jgi:hypothetical protein
VRPLPSERGVAGGTSKRFEQGRDEPHASRRPPPVRDIDIEDDAVRGMVRPNSRLIGAPKASGCGGRARSTRQGHGWEDQTRADGRGRRHAVIDDDAIARARHEGRRRQGRRCRRPQSQSAAIAPSRTATDLAFAEQVEADTSGN